jgi:N-acetyl-1-D-myo-inositol-2-amino-2-deoxy-alpha-D-glucopyranoside deacetylase
VPGSTGSTGSAGPRGLLSIFPHPDDESYGAGGLMALAAAAGNPVWVLCVTNGDQGGRPGETDVDHSLDPEIRCRELTCACEALGVNEPIFLGYRDSGMEGWGAPEGSLSKADPEEVVGRLVEAIRRLRPAVVVTFDPGGVYGHPDHVTCSARATEAYRRAAAEPGGPIALYHQALPRSRVAGMRAAMEEERRRSGDTTPPSEDDMRQQEAFERLARPDEEITTIVAIGEVLERKVAALACHDSQMRGRQWDDPEVREGLAQMFGHETFVRVDPAPKPGEREDLPMGLEWGNR